MKKYFLLALIILFFCSIAPVNLSAYSFEIYSDHPYPDVTATADFDKSSGTATITAEIVDASGVCSARATINSVVSNLTMQRPDPINAPDSWVASYTSESEWTAGTYWVNISATDCLGNDSMSEGNEYLNITSFAVATDATGITLNINPTSANPLDSVSLVATLTSGGSELGGKTVHFN